MNAEIVIVDDEEELADLLEIYLEGDGHHVHKFYNASDALEYIRNDPPDLAILDVMLPDMSGFQLCRKIREDYFFPIIMATAKIEDADKIKGLMLGADDYIEKPFNPMELTARVKTQLRRCKRYDRKIFEESRKEEREEYDIRGLVINRRTHRCFLYEEELQLTPIEFSILWYLCGRRGEAVSSDELFEAVWGEKFYSSNNNTVIVHIGRLREKLKDSQNEGGFIKTIWGVGYKIE